MSVKVIEITRNKYIFQFSNYWKNQHNTGTESRLHRVRESSAKHDGRPSLLAGTEPGDQQMQA